MNPDYAYTTAYGWAIKHEEAMRENERLREIFPKILDALESGNCSPDCSVEFLEEIPQEVRLVVAKVREENKSLKARFDEIEEYRTNSPNSDDIPRHSFEANRNEHHDEECSTCIECGEPITPLNDGHNDECPVYKSLIANLQKPRI